MQSLYEEKLKKLFKKNLSLTPSMVEKLLIFLAGLEAQEKINQEQASQKQETQQQK